MPTFFCSAPLLSRPAPEAEDLLLPRSGCSLSRPQLFRGPGEALSRLASWACRPHRPQSDSAARVAAPRGSRMVQDACVDSSLAPAPQELCAGVMAVRPGSTRSPSLGVCPSHTAPVTSCRGQARLQLLTKAQGLPAAGARPVVQQEVVRHLWHQATWGRRALHRPCVGVSLQAAGWAQPACAGAHSPDFAQTALSLAPAYSVFVTSLDKRHAGRTRICQLLRPWQRLAGSVPWRPSSRQAWQRGGCP